jgi:hypothetical protein
MVDRLMGRWLVRARVAVKAYNDATTRTVTAERRLGVPAVALSAVVATGIFATLQSSPATGWKIATGLIAALAATLTALQTFFRQTDRAEQFREAARGYGRMRRQLELARAFPPKTKEQAKETVTTLAGELAETSVGKPNVNQSVWDRAEYFVKGTSEARGYRALAIWLRERLSFGLDVAPGPLPEDHERYFEMDGAEVVSLSALSPSKQAEDQPKAVHEARRRMHQAAVGRRSRRAPLTVLEGAPGSYTIVDGNATFAVAERESWKTVPIKVVVATDGGGGA